VLADVGMIQDTRRRRPLPGRKTDTFLKATSSDQLNAISVTAPDPEQRDTDSHGSKKGSAPIVSQHSNIAEPGCEFDCTVVEIDP
jgi:hypothetical protein